MAFAGNMQQRACFIMAPGQARERMAVQGVAFAEPMQGFAPCRVVRTGLHVAGRAVSGDELPEPASAFAGRGLLQHGQGRVDTAQRMIVDQIRIFGGLQIRILVALVFGQGLGQVFGEIHQHFRR